MIPVPDAFAPLLTQGELGMNVDAKWGLLSCMRRLSPQTTSLQVLNQAEVGNTTSADHLLQRQPCHHCIHMASDAIPRLVTEGHPMLCRLAASPCQCRSKTQLLTNVSYTAEQLYCLDQAGLGGQCIAPSTVNLGLTIHTGWTCQLMNETMRHFAVKTAC